MKVTVVIPAYNAEKHLIEAVESVLNQSHKNFELIAVNDGSQDNTKSILDALAAKDSRIRIIHQENKGIAETLNYAMHQANTEWIAIMHADDVMLPNRLERQVFFAQQNPDIRAFSCMATYIGKSGKEMGKTSSDLFTREKFEWYVQHNEAIGLLHPGVMLHRETVLSIGGYRQPFWPAEDIDLWNRLAENKHLVLVQNEVLMKYRIHTGSVSTSRFSATRLKYEWVRACMHARRSHSQEPTWENFSQEWRNAPLLMRMNRSRKSNAKAYYHAAGHDCLCGQFLPGMAKLFVAAVLQPEYVLPRLKDQILK